MSQTTVTRDEVRRRTILRSDWVPCKAAFIDCRTPGSDRKDNYSFIGSGVSQSSEQFVNLTEPHGFNLGAAGMPRGTDEQPAPALHGRGVHQLRRRRTGCAGVPTVARASTSATDGDVISVPTWIFRGFTNEGPDDGILLTVLGRDDTGGIIWGPTVLQEAAGLRAAAHGGQPPHRHCRGRRGARPTSPLISPMAQAGDRQAGPSLPSISSAPGSSPRPTAVGSRSASCARGLPGGRAELARSSASAWRRTARVAPAARAAQLQPGLAAGRRRVRAC